jgi:tRNA(Ile)-lysidine synthase
LTVRKLGGGPTGNVQAWARERRYSAARELAAPLGAAVATGHTATDQVETVLYRLAASPGRRALLGMAADELQYRGVTAVTRRLQAAPRARSRAECRARLFGGTIPA